MLTGKYPVDGAKLIVADSPRNFPPFGAVAAKMRPVEKPIPAFVHLPEFQWNNGGDIAGQSAGVMGGRVGPFVGGDPSLPGYQGPGLEVLAGGPLERSGGRHAPRRGVE